jgi:hypothetical protein
MEPMLFRRRLPLAPPNVPPDWVATDAWREWEAPKDLTRGGYDHMEALAALAGRPRPGGWLLPVAATLVRDPHHDAIAIRVEVADRQVGRLAAILARQLAPRMDRDGIRGFAVCAVIRGGSPESPGLGVHLWLGRRPAQGPELLLDGELGDVPWPPDPGEGAS